MNFKAEPKPVNVELPAVDPHSIIGRQAVMLEQMALKIKKLTLRIMELESCAKSVSGSG